jgi:hypothetical protein
VPRERTPRERPANEPAAVAAWSPDLSQCKEETYPIEVGPEHRLMVRMNLDPDERIVEFNLIQLVRVGVWTPVYRVCTSHAMVHVHRYRRDGTTDRIELAPITSVNDVMRAFDEQYGAILDGWDDNLRWWNGEG